MNRRGFLAGAGNAALALALTACGGGSGSVVAPPAPTPTPTPTPPANEVNVDNYPSVAAAYDAVPAGGTMRFSNKRYRWFTDNERLPTIPPARNMLKPVRCIGAGVPSENANATDFVDGTGTIIDGSVFFQGSGFEFDGLGINVGDDFCRTNFGGRAQDGLVSYDVEQLAYPAVPDWIGLKIGDIAVLASGHFSDVHSVLIENQRDFDIRSIRATKGGAGPVFKAGPGRIGLLKVSGSLKYGALIKSEAYKQALGIVIEQLELRHFGPVAPDFNLPSCIFTGSIEGNRLTVYDTNGRFAVGVQINAPGIIPGTKITAFENATGGVGTYTVDKPQNVARQPFICANYNTGGFQFEASYADCIDNVINRYTCVGTLNGIDRVARVSGGSSNSVVNCNTRNGTLSNIANYVTHDIGPVADCWDDGIEADGSLNGQFFGDRAARCRFRGKVKSSANYSFENSGTDNVWDRCISETPKAPAHVRAIAGRAQVTGGLQAVGGSARLADYLAGTIAGI